MTREPLMNLFLGIPASNKTGISTTLRTLEPDSELTSLQETPTSVSLVHRSRVESMYCGILQFLERRCE